MKKIYLFNLMAYAHAHTHTHTCQVGSINNVTAGVKKKNAANTVTMLVMSMLTAHVTPSVGNHRNIEEAERLPLI